MLNYQRVSYPWFIFPNGFNGYRESFHRGGRSVHSRLVQKNTRCISMFKVAWTDSLTTTILNFKVICWCERTYTEHLGLHGFMDLKLVKFQVTRYICKWQASTPRAGRKNWGSHDMGTIHRNHSEMQPSHMGRCFEKSTNENVPHRFF